MDQAVDDEVIIERVAAIDVGKAEGGVLRTDPRPPGGRARAVRVQEVRKASTMTRSLMELADWLASLGDPGGDGGDQ